MNNVSFRRLAAGLQVSGPGEAAVLCGSHRAIAGVLRPRSAGEVAQLIQAAHRDGGIQLHPISRGRNWGFGSHLPADDGAWVLDLSLMDKIRAIDEEDASAWLEPGVSQGQLDDELQRRDRPLFLNVTGAGREGSLIGNALEKGVGYFGQRDQDLLALEIVLGTGEMVTITRHEVGPELLGAFCQSAFGVITAAKVALRHSAALHGAILFQMEDEVALAGALSVLARAKAEGWLDSVPHIGNRARVRSTLPAVAEKPIAAWTGVVPLHGPVTIVRAQAETLRQQLGARCVSTVCVDDAFDQKAWTSILELARGIPSNVALSSVSRAALGRDEGASDLDEGEAGLIHVTPQLPASAVADLLEVIATVSRKQGVEEPPMTINVVDGRRTVGVISIPFRRSNQASAQAARAFADELLIRLAARGMLPYRLGLDQISRLPIRNSASETISARLTQLMDPRGIFARSRYVRPPIVELNLEKHHLTEELSCVAQ